MLSYIDTTGVTTLKKLVQSHSDIAIEVLLTGCPVHIETMLKKDGFFKEVSSDRVYKSVHDAVIMIRGTGPNIGMPIVPIHQNNLTRVISKISMDSFRSFDDCSDYKVFDSHKNMLGGGGAGGVSISCQNSPQLTRVRPFRSGTFHNL